MKTITLLLLAVILMGCGTVVETQASAMTTAEYRHAMESGTIASTAVVSTSLCEATKASKAECDEFKLSLIGLSVRAIDAVTDEQITLLNTSQSTYKSAMKEGANLFSSIVGNTMCRSLKTTPTRCASLQEMLKTTTNQFIDSLSDEAIRKLQDGAKPKGELEA